MQKNKKLATHLSTLAVQQKASALAAYEHDSLLLPSNASSRLQAENDMERTWKVSQDDIREAVGSATAQKSFSLNLADSGFYELDYSVDGRNLAIAGKRGHVATFDWQTGKLGTEMHLNETVRDICWLHDTSFFAVAQKKYAYIYDSNGLEIHQLRNHIEVNRMQFLKYHFLLATVGNAGYLKYQDTSTGSLIAEHRTRLGPCHTMAQNKHSAVISLGHSNGTITMWTPNMSTAHIKMLAHRGPVSAIAHDPSSIGTYFATAGLDGSMKVWDARKWEVVNEWQLQRPATSLAYSQTGLLASAWGHHATIYADSTKKAQRAPGPYMTQTFPSTSTQSLAFCPFEDILGVGHARGFTSLLIPGAGESNFDSLEADPFESKKARREREVVSLLDKLQPDQIHMDADFIGKLAPQLDDSATSVNAALGAVQKKQPKPDFAQMSRLKRLEATEQNEDGDSDAENEGTTAATVSDAKVKKPRGRNKVLKRILRRKKNVIDEKTMRVRELIDQRRRAALDRRVQEQRNSRHGDGGALDRFI
ncbi:BING4CT-domain-containing protein [Cystobasidium minutum MCA 4210]|uniref:BING4CT-domain-containing protein n=1 Tax=Cystobasidium minutum MCA 4210 TaxID=1397322 RepID=UPI0034CD1D25|eukprot:jgi/Rhomi1/139418/e_gw1.1.253.1